MPFLPMIQGNERQTSPLTHPPNVSDGNRYGKDALFVKKDGLDEMGDGGAYRLFCVSLLFNDLVCSLFDFCRNLLLEPFKVFNRETLQRQGADFASGPEGKLAVAVFSDDIGMNIFSIDIDLLSDRLA